MMTTELLHAPRRMAAVLEEPAIPRAPEGLEPALRLMFSYAQQTRLPLVCVDAARGTVLAASEPNAEVLMPLAAWSQLLAAVQPQVVELSIGLVAYALPLTSGGDRRLVAIGAVRSRPDASLTDLTILAAERGWSPARFQRWLARQSYAAPGLVQALLEMAVRQIGHDEREAGWQMELHELSAQIEQTYEEISLLHNLTRRLQLSRSPLELAELCLLQLHELVRAEGLMLWIEERRGTGQALVRGTLPFDEMGAARLLAWFDTWDWSRPLVRNGIAATPLGRDVPGLDNLVIVPIAEGNLRFGWILAVNVVGRGHFGTVEASLLNSVAAILGTHIRNIDLYDQHDELLIGFVRSLVSTLDAKDPYTRGHSERVALIARRLAAHLGLNEAEQQEIYMAGLLHDIGKIGVDDTILQKPGKLTDEEFRQVQEHPMLGYSILHKVRSLQHVLPGVRNHHESFDGTGYPDRLVGEDIPLMARILAVADSYDAMNSDRPYRPGMPLDQVEHILRRGAGRQWDPNIIAAYFARRDEIRQQCATYSSAEGSHGELAETSPTSTWSEEVLCP